MGSRRGVEVEVDRALRIGLGGEAAPTRHPVQTHELLHGTVYEPKARFSKYSLTVMGSSLSESAPASAKKRSYTPASPFARA